MSIGLLKSPCISVVKCKKIQSMLSNVWIDTVHVSLEKTSVFNDLTTKNQTVK